MITTRHRWLAGLLPSIGMSIAIASEPKPGTYILDGNLGTLDIRRDQNNKLVFEILSIGGNGHICKPSGTIVGTLGRTDYDDPELRCDIAFEADGSAVTVRPLTEESCRTDCGVRASFEGIYRAPPANCEPSAREAQREKSLALHRAGKYTEAVTTVKGLVAQCERFMSWIEIDELRNDLALSHYHQGQYAQCIATIDETTAGRLQDEQELRGLTPFDFDNYILIAKATWLNKELCVKAMKGKSRPARPTPATTSR